MKGGLDLAGRTVPTLIEVVRPRRHSVAAPNLADAVDPADPVLAAELSRRVLVELHCRLADDLEAQLRLALAPVIADLTTQLLHETQLRVAGTLREMIREAVARELAARQEP